MMKKILMPTMALLVLSAMTILPVKAMTKGPYSSTHEMDLVLTPSIKIWEADGILHIRDSYWVGTYDGTMGVGTWEAWFIAYSLNLATGEGTMTGKWRITIDTGPKVGTLEGIGRGKISGYVSGYGTFAGTRGTGDFDGVKKRGSFTFEQTGDFPSLHIVMVASGTIMWP